jgi:hypothetical protein
VASVPEVKIIEVVKALIFAAGMASSVAQADISSASASLARQYGVSSSREVEAEIARHLRNRG